MSDLLNLRNASSAYGKSQVIFDVSFDMRPGAAGAILGRNGVGKTTLLKTIMGQQKLIGGQVLLNGEDVSSYRAHERARAGVGFVPQGRHVFPHLTVDENLSVGLSALEGRGEKGKASVPDYIFDLFPKLKDIAHRKAGVLSGGEQQQLAMGRALAGKPSLLLLDEPTEGIQPNIVQQIEAALLRIRKDLGVSILIVEQNLDFAWAFADHYYVMQKGRIVREGLTAADAPAEVTHLIHV